MSIAELSMPLPPHELAYKPRSWLEIAGWSALSATTALIPLALSTRAARRSRGFPIVEMFAAQFSLFVWAPGAAVVTAVWMINTDAQREAGALQQLNQDRQWVDSMNTSRVRANNP